MRIRTLLPAATTAGIAVLAMTPRMPVVFGWDKADHVVAFGGLAAALMIATGRPMRSFVIASGAAATVEIAQGALPSLGRECSIADLVVGVVAAGSVCAIGAVLRSSRRSRPDPNLIETGKRRVMDIRDFGRDVERRRQALGIVDTPESIDALRNKGHRRTESKKTLLREIARSSREQGVEPPPAYIDGERI